MHAMLSHMAYKVRSRGHQSKTGIFSGSAPHASQPLTGAVALCRTQLIGRLTSCTCPCATGEPCSLRVAFPGGSNASCGMHRRP